MSPLRIVVALVVVLALATGVHYYLWLRLVKNPVWPQTWASVATWVLITLAVSMPIALAGARLLPRPVASPLVWVSMIWLGAVFLLLVFLLPSEVVRLAADWTGRSAKEIADPERRLFLSRGVAAAASTGAFGLTGWSVVGALRPVDVKRVDVPIAGLPEGLGGFRIVQLSDIHVGPTIGRDFIEELVARTNALEPDLIAITGDLVDGSVADLAEHVAPLARLRARHGVFFVTGNHEYYSGASEWIVHLESLGLRVLKNERETIDHDGALLDVAGVHDWNSDRFEHVPDIGRALDGKAAERPVILLAHQPRQIDGAADHGVTLQLSGHTHGGQIFPFNYLVLLQQPYVAGLHEHDGTMLYVSSGTGYWGPPMRLGIPAEITHLELAAS